MATNKFSQECKECGEIVLPGKGILTSEWSNQDDDQVWVVRHADKSVCKAVAQAQAEETARAETVQAIVNYIKAYGEKIAITDGAETIYDGRVGYNGVGWLITATDGDLYMTSRNNLDGWDMSETYYMADGEDDGYGNSNADIIRILTSGKSASTKAFEL